MNRHHVHLLTAAGAGAIGVLRLRGPRADGLLERVFRPASGRALTQADAGSVFYGQIVAGREVIDHVLVCVVARRPAPVIEMTCHGGVRVVERLIEAVGDAGFRFFPDGVDIWSEAEATPIARSLTAALRRARTDRAVRFLAAQRVCLAGRVRDALASLRDDPPAGRLALKALIAHAESARRLIEGARIALAGPPNAGKSTLFNRLLGRNAVVAFDGAGTTRDWVQAEIEIAGVPITLFDTAGLSEEASGLDQAAIAAGLSAIKSADLVLAVFDGGAGDVVRPFDSLRQRLPDTSVVVCLNKSDLPWPAGPGRIGGVSAIAVSARTGEGVSVLLDEVMRMLVDGRFREDAPCLVDREQVAAVGRALSDRAELRQASPALAEALLGDDLR